MKGLTEQIVQRISPAGATRHPFLAAAGAGTLDANDLALWLHQDRIYAAHAYPRFIGTLISKIPFTHHWDTESPEYKLDQRTLELLSFSLTNIIDEVRFFDAVAGRHGLDVKCWKERKGTRDYTAEMGRMAIEDLELGVVFLWAMERVYLDAWSEVASNIKKIPASEDEDPAISAVRELSARWSSREFVKFVDDLASLVNILDVVKNRHSDNWREQAECIWRRVIELEVDFWPTTNEHLRMWREEFQ